MKQIFRGIEGLEGVGDGAHFWLLIWAIYFNLNKLESIRSLVLGLLDRPEALLPTILKKGRGLRNWIILKLKLLNHTVWNSIFCPV